MGKEDIKEKDNTIKAILSIIGFIYLGWVIFEGTTVETVLQQQYIGLRIIAGWLYLIWIAIITK